MSGWDDLEIPSQKQPNNRPNTNHNNNNNGQRGGGNNNNNYNNNNNNNYNNRNNNSNSNNNYNNNNNSKPPAQQKVLYIEKDGPRRFQFFNSKGKAEEKPATNDNEERKDNAVTQQPQQAVSKEAPVAVQEQQKESSSQQQAQQQQQQQPAAGQAQGGIMPFLLPQSQLPKFPPMVNPNMNAPHEIILRSKKGIYASSTYSQSFEGARLLFSGCADFMAQTNDQKHIVVAVDTMLSVIRVSDAAVIKERKFVNLKHTHLSKQNNFIQVFDNIENKKFVSYIISFPNLEIIHEFAEKRFLKENAPYVKFNEAETKGFYYNFTTGFIEAYDVKDFKEPIQTAEMQNLDFFQLSPKHEFITGCFLEHMVGYEKTQAKLQFYNMETNKRERVKNIEKAQEIALNWSPDGSKVIITTQTTHDASGNTYYGQTSLWLYSFGSKKLELIPTCEGPVHTVDWSADGEHFIVIVGYMPAKPVLYTLKCEPIFSFGTMHRNTIRFQPQGQFVLLGGFGNLPGDVDIWDLRALERITKFNAPISASIEWSLDGKNILSGVLTPRLRMDNNFKLFKWNGELLNVSDFSNTELYEIVWKKNQAYADKTPIAEKDIKDEIDKHRKSTKAQQKQSTPNFGGGSFASMLRSDRGDEGPKKITGNEEWLIKAKLAAKKLK